MNEKFGEQYGGKQGSFHPLTEEYIPDDKYVQWLESQLTEAQAELTALKKQIQDAPKIELVAEIPPASVPELLLFYDDSPVFCLDCNFKVGEKTKVALVELDDREDSEASERSEQEEVK